MTDDIVEQLRHRAKWDIIAGSSFDIGMCIDAADEIERLRELIIYWCDIEDDLSGHPSDYHQNVANALEELRKAVGR